MNEWPPIPTVTTDYKDIRHWFTLRLTKTILQRKEDGLLALIPNLDLCIFGSPIQFINVSFWQVLLVDKHSCVFRLGVWIFPRLQRNKQRKVIVWRNFTTRKSSKVVHFHRKTCWPHGTETETQVLMKNISHYSEPKRINTKSSFNLVIKTALGNNLRKLLQLTKNVQPPRPRHMRISKIKDYRSPSSWRISVFQSSVFTECNHQPLLF